MVFISSGHPCYQGVYFVIMNDDQSDYRNEIELLVKWSNNNSLILNVNETKEFTVDFRKC